MVSLQLNTLMTALPWHLGFVFSLAPFSSNCNWCITLVIGVRVPGYHRSIQIFYLVKPTYASRLRMSDVPCFLFYPFYNELPYDSRHNYVVTMCSLIARACLSLSPIKLELGLGFNASLHRGILCHRLRFLEAWHVLMELTHCKWKPRAVDAVIFEQKQMSPELNICDCFRISAFSCCHCHNW